MYRLISTYQPLCLFLFFFFNDTATTEIYTLSLHDALPISPRGTFQRAARAWSARGVGRHRGELPPDTDSHLRSEEHTSELQSQSNLVCRLLLEKKKNIINRRITSTYRRHDPRTAITRARTR